MVVASSRDLIISLVFSGHTPIKFINTRISTVCLKSQKYLSDTAKNTDKKIFEVAATFAAT